MSFRAITIHSLAHIRLNNLECYHLYKDLEKRKEKHEERWVKKTALVTRHLGSAWGTLGINGQSMDFKAGFRLPALYFPYSPNSPLVSSSLNNFPQVFKKYFQIPQFSVSAQLSQAASFLILFTMLPHLLSSPTAPWRGHGSMMTEQASLPGLLARNLK